MNGMICLCLSSSFSFFVCTRQCFKRKALLRCDSNSMLTDITPQIFSVFGSCFNQNLVYHCQFGTNILTLVFYIQGLLIFLNHW